MKNVVTIIQARMGSSRLPGKVLRNFGDQPVLKQIVDRVSLSRLASTIVVATSLGAKDDAIEAFCRRESITCFRGSERDVLRRYAECASRFHADVVVRVTADCPFIEPALLDRVVEAHLDEKADYVFMSDLPTGIGAETLSRAALDISNRLAVRPDEREHVIYYVTRRPEEFRVVFLSPPSAELSKPRIRLTLDYEEDYALLGEVNRRLGARSRVAALDEILGVVQDDPKLLALATRSV